MSKSLPPGFDDAKKIWKEKLAAAVVKALQSRGHNALYVSGKEDALKTVMAAIPEGATVGIPGTVTIREIGAIEALEARGNRVFHHWDPSLTAETRKQRLKDEWSSDFFLTSSNALTCDGVMVNIDGTGNRLAGMCWAPGKIIYVIGMNKLCRNTESAIKRVRDVAAPINAYRLGIDADSGTPGTLCRGILITENAMTGRDSKVILVGEDLGY